MNTVWNRWGGVSAIVVGLLSLLYAIFFLVIARQAEFVGAFGSWVILAASGIFSSAAYVALYQRLKDSGENGFILWALLMGSMSSFATLVHGGQQALLLNLLRNADPAMRMLIESARMLPSQVDPAGLATFGVVGLVTALWSWHILRFGTLPRGLGYLGLVNALLLIVLYAATAANLQNLILISGGLTAVIAGPIWWIWLGMHLLRPLTNQTTVTLHPAPIH
jgi:hypothetical protein